MVASTDQDAADEAERLPGSLAANTLALVLSEKRPLNVLALDGVTPSVKALVQGQYPHFKSLFIVTRPDAAASVNRFIAFVKSAPEKSARLKRPNILIERMLAERKLGASLPTAASVENADGRSRLAPSRLA